MLTAAAEAQAKTGHDALPFFQWDAFNYGAELEPVDDVVQSLDREIRQVRSGGRISRQTEGPLARGSRHRSDREPDLLRPDQHSEKVSPASISRRCIRRNRAATPEAAGWTYDAFLKAAEACAKAGFPFGMGVGSTGDSLNNVGAIFRAFGAELVSAKGEITVDSDNVRQVLEYGQKLVKFFPSDTVSYDDASNNRALISGKSAMIWNPPSAWAVAKRDAPEVAKDCWTFPCPAGPNGRYIPYVYMFYGIWTFSKNKTAAKELLAYLMQRKQIEERDMVCEGFNLPPQVSMSDFKIWAEVEPPKGTMYNYPIRPWHNSLPSVAAYPSPPEYAIPITNRAVISAMWARLHSGQSINEVVAWAKDELEGYVR